MKNKNTAIYFDMDGVLCDWVDAFHKALPEMSLSDFNKLSSKERKILKEKIFGYKFFREMKPIKNGVELLKEYQKEYENVFILSAVGDTSHVADIEKAKIEWLEENVGKVSGIFFVNKVEYKYLKKQNGFENHILIDDRESSINAWKENGLEGILFK